MKIIHIIPNLKKGGAERLVKDICGYIYKNKLSDVKLITFHEENSELDYHKNIPSWFKPSISSKEEYEINKLQLFIDDFNPDIIHSHLWESEILLTKINSRKAVRFTHFHDNIIQLQGALFSAKKKNFTFFYEKKLFLKNNKNQFICISNDTYKYAKKVIPKKLKQNITLIPNAINYDKFFDIEKKNNNEIQLINVGSFVSKKNQRFAIDILNVLKKENLNVSLTLIGDGDLKKELEEYVEELNLTKYIVFVGNVNHVEDYLKSSNIYLHTATYEPFGLVILEAMAAGLPVVSLDGKGNRDFMKNGENGFIFSDQNPNVFALKIKELLKNQNLFDKISVNGQKTAERYNIKNYVSNLIKLYEDILKSNRENL